MSVKSEVKSKGSERASHRSPSCPDSTTSPPPALSSSPRTSPSTTKGETDYNHLSPEKSSSSAERPFMGFLANYHSHARSGILPGLPPQTGLKLAFPQAHFPQGFSGLESSLALAAASHHLHNGSVTSPITPMIPNLVPFPENPGHQFPDCNFSPYFAAALAAMGSGSAKLDCAGQTLPINQVLKPRLP